MNNRVYELLVFLMNTNGNNIHLSELADSFEVNVRTIRNYLSNIEDFLYENNYKDILVKNGGNITFLVDDNQTKDILSIASKSNFYDYKLSSVERQLIICIMLLLSDIPITIADFEDTLFASRSTIKKDISLAVNILRDYNVFFSENKRNGYILDIDECTRRNVIYNFIKENALSKSSYLTNTYKDICMYYIKQQINFDFYFPRVENALFILEQHFGIVMTDMDFTEITLLLCIICYRLSKNKNIEDSTESYSKSDNILYDISEYVTKLIINNENYTRSDIIYISNKLQYKISYKNNAPINQELMNYYIIVKGFLYKLSQNFNINLQEDYKLQEFLTAHIARVCHRVKENDLLTNPYKESLIASYPLDFKILSDNIGYLEENLNIKINEDESSYILMHIEASLEKIRQNLIIPNVIIVCHVGFGTSHFLEERLSKHFKLNVIDIISSHKLKEYLDNGKLNCDLIISTIPLVNIPTPWIQVNPILSNNDILQVNQIISDTLNKIKINTSFTNKEKPTKYATNFTSNTDVKSLDSQTESTFSSLLSDDSIILDKAAETWQESIILSGEPLLWNGIITPNYIQAVVNNVIDNGPYFVFAPGIAIAHASPKDGAKKLGASFVRLKNPVKFGHKTNDPINIVIMLSVINTKKNLNMLFTTMNTLCDPIAVKQFMSSKSKNDIIDIFRYYENCKH